MTQNAKPKSDETLMAEVKNGESAALGDLFLRHGAPVKSLIRRYAVNVCETELDDLVQETFLQLRRTAAFYRESGTFRAWLFAIAVQIAKNRAKQGAVRAALLKAHDSKPIAVSPRHSGTPEDTVAMRDLILKLFRKLPAEQQEVLILYEVEGFSAQEIGMVLDITENAVWTRLHRARKAVLSHIRKVDTSLADRADAPREALP